MLGLQMLLMMAGQWMMMIVGGDEVLLIERMRAGHGRRRARQTRTRTAFPAGSVGLGGRRAAASQLLGWWLGPGLSVHVKGFVLSLETGAVVKGMAVDVWLVMRLLLLLLLLRSGRGDGWRSGEQQRSCVGRKTVVIGGG